MKKNHFLQNMTFMLLIFLSGLAWAQSTGDFMSRNYTVNSGTGAWNDYKTWQIYTASGWQDAVSGQYPGAIGYTSSTVTVKCYGYDTNSNAIAPVKGSGSYVTGQTVVVYGELQITGNFTLTTASGPITLNIEGGVISWVSNGDFTIPAQSIISIKQNALGCRTGNLVGLKGDATCNASQRLYIGNSIYTTCNGGANPDVGTFDNVNSSGGTFKADISDYKICAATSLNVSGGYTGAVSANTITYSLTKVSGPIATFSPALPASGNLKSGSTITNPKVLTVLSSADTGTYVLQLSVSDGSNTFKKDFTVQVGATTTYNGTWDNGSPDSNGLNVIIAKDYNTNSGSISACNCTVNSGSLLTIASGTSLTIVNNLTANNNINVESDGNLVQVNDAAVNSGNILVKRNMVFRSDERKEYNYLLSPVENANLKTDLYRKADGTAVTAPFVLYHNEANNFFYTSSGAYIKGRALAVKEPLYSSSAVPTAFFTGKPFNGTIDYNLAYSGITLGYNLVGNPYPSNLDLNLLYSNNKTEIESTFRFWDNTVNTIYQQQGSTYTGNAYAIYNAAAGTNGTGLPAPGSGQVAPGLPNGSKIPNKIAKIGQGFMVRSLGPGKILKYSNTARLADNTAAVFFGKQGPDDRFWLTMKAPSGITSSMAVVYFGAGSASFGVDDSPVINSSDNLYSFAQDEKVAINGRNSFVNTDKINLGSSHFVQGTYTIALGDREGVFANGQNIYLKDKQAGTITNLNTADYTFTAAAGESTGRFEVVYEPQTILATDAVTKEALSVYRDGGDFVVKAEVKKITALDLYDASGKLVFRLAPNSVKVNFGAEGLANGMYILKISQNGQITTKKIMR